MQELKGNIRVHCRVRPLLPFDAAEPDGEASQDSPAGTLLRETLLHPGQRRAHPSSCGEGGRQALSFTDPHPVQGGGVTRIPPVVPTREPAVVDTGRANGPFRVPLVLPPPPLPCPCGGRGVHIRVHVPVHIPVHVPVHIRAVVGSGPGDVARALDDETVLVKCHRPGHPDTDRMYSFERVYGPAESQAAVFEDVRPLLTSLLDGYNVCIMAYGQTGSGKSHTMLGPPPDAPPDPGVVPRAADELFRLLAENPSQSPRVDVSVVEIYNNDVYDLLAKGRGGAAVAGARREVVTTPEGQAEVPGLTCRAVTSAVEFVGLLHGGLRLRVTHPTLVHADSSRSHLVVTVTLTTAAPPCSTDPPSSPAPGQERAGAGRWQSGPRRESRPWLSPAEGPGSRRQRQTKLQLVDLAGSECVGASGVTGEARRETSFINRSLAALADVLGALSAGGGHVPYRNSKLTHLLRDSIGGDAKLLLLLCVAPGRARRAETLQSLAFGARARQARRGRPGGGGPRAPPTREPPAPPAFLSRSPGACEPRNKRGCAGCTESPGWCSGLRRGGHEGGAAEAPAGLPEGLRGLGGSLPP
ncbi:kinesin-like protein KIF25 [Perognathus longimembris pacificus]|uniref:kinesin-like protein KIF25 n=1 Tax=Perognathus longimembris pacificus TaxID=214514 RepID=UPI00201A012F|nr:kinesin-like protein KIF25 [Perognathus longimembris pacificus]